MNWNVYIEPIAEGYHPFWAGNPEFIGCFEGDNPKEAINKSIEYDDRNGNRKAFDPKDDDWECYK